MTYFYIPFDFSVEMMELRIYVKVFILWNKIFLIFLNMDSILQLILFLEATLLI